MGISIRLEKESDYSDVEYITREAFWNVYKPGCDEHLIVHKMRKVPAFINELCFVACDNDKIVGNIMYSKAKIINNMSEEFIILCMGPISVLPSYQNKGIGTMLMNYSIEQAKNLGYKAVVIYGNPNYYHRFGFKNSKEYGIKTPDGENFEEFMTLELIKDGLKDIKGCFFADKVFEVNADELEAFEKQFPYKQKLITDTQLK